MTKTNVLLILIFLSSLTSSVVYTGTKVRSRSFYALDPVSTKSLNNCANICSARRKSGGTVSGFVYRHNESVCAPINFAAFETDVEGLAQEDLVTAYLPDGKLPERQTSGTSPGRRLRCLYHDEVNEWASNQSATYIQSITFAVIEDRESIPASFYSCIPDRRPL